VERALPAADKANFTIGGQVHFNDESHWIFGHLSVR
jgi:hypothetical protein